MANEENLKGKGFDSRTTEELREIATKGGKASGEARRRKADFRKALNALLTAEINNPEWTPLLESLGLDSTLESAVNGAMIKEALNGNVKAYEVIAKYSGQSDKTDASLEEQQSKTELNKARKQAVTGENETDEALGKLDKILKEVHDNAVKQETE
ncbi:MAG TPA: hypothetical protein IAC41_06910 [Candidatus Merdenecus merdavium]|nr:hypothetical protein [Candidatus Merdenecus merdavium]